MTEMIKTTMAAFVVLGMGTLARSSAACGPKAPPYIRFVDQNSNLNPSCIRRKSSSRPVMVEKLSTAAFSVLAYML